MLSCIAHCPGSRVELRIQIVRGIPPTSCLHCPVMNNIYQLDLQKLFYDANINSYQHAMSTGYVSDAMPSAILSILAPLISTTL